MKSLEHISCGNRDIDDIVNYLRYGDNVVWHTDSIENYSKIVDMFVKESLKTGKNFIYIRFASHQRLIGDEQPVKVYALDAKTGFEYFTLQVRKIIESEGYEAFYVFDCLSELLDHWATDMMIANFFCVTCPFLYKLDTIAYFAVLQNNHSHKTIARIRETTQLLIDVGNVEDSIYIHPLKVWNRYSPTMFLPHVSTKDGIVPVTNSDEAARILSKVPELRLGNMKARLDYWDKLFIFDQNSDKDMNMLFKRILRLIAGSDEKMLLLAENYFDMEDLHNIKARMIGSGAIGGKAVGMLLARKILEKEVPELWAGRIEKHDSFYIGADVFYTYIVQNNCWELFIEQKKAERFLQKANELKQKLIEGSFTEEIKESLMQVLEYFGQSPVIIRSSSLLEDGYGNAFSGKYDSFFCANQGPIEKRYKEAEDAIRKIYASTMNEDALSYRLKRGLAAREEQMAILIQRVSGDYQGRYFFPLIAGVGFSYNMYVWKPEMDVKEGMLRLVMGLGTRAVNRTEGDYPRIMALDHPRLQPFGDKEDQIRYSQHSIDLLDLLDNSFKTVMISKLLWEKIPSFISLLGSKDYETQEKLERLGIKGQLPFMITYDGLIENMDVIMTMKKLLKTLEAAYDYPVDIEYTINFQDEENYKINVLQCRPLQTKGIVSSNRFPDKKEIDEILFDIRGNFMGGNVLKEINKIIYIVPDEYYRLNESGKYETARSIGRIMRMCGENESVMLMGPGRWGTTTASLGVPISFSEISRVSVLCEIAYETGGMTPELSYGSHFFQDLVEEDIFYAAIFTNDKEAVFWPDYITKKTNLFDSFLPDATGYGSVIKVVDTQKLRLISDIKTQRVLCYTG